MEKENNQKNKTKKVKIYYYILTFVLIVVVGFSTIFIVRSLNTYHDKYVGEETIEMVGATSTSKRAKYKSALTIELSGENLELYNKAINTLLNDNEGHIRELVVRVALQILEANVLTFDNNDYYISSEWNQSCANRGQERYSLVSYINYINNKKICYINNFGFAKLVFSISAYSIDNQNPKDVSKLNSLYGENGNIEDLTKLKTYSLKTGTLLTENEVTDFRGEKNIRTVGLLVAKTSKKTDNEYYIITYSSIIIAKEKGGIAFELIEQSESDSPIHFTLSKDYLH